MEGKTEVERADLETKLAGPEKKEDAFDEINRRAQADPRLRVGMIAPPPRKV